MSRDDIIDEINSSGADFLVASLGAKKGQSVVAAQPPPFADPSPSSSGCRDQFSSRHG